MAEFVISPISHKNARFIDKNGIDAGLYSEVKFIDKNGSETLVKFRVILPTSILSSYNVTNPEHINDGIMSGSNETQWFWLVGEPSTGGGGVTLKFDDQWVVIRSIRVYSTGNVSVYDREDYQYWYNNAKFGATKPAPLWDNEQLCEVRMYLVGEYVGTTRTLEIIPVLENLGNYTDIQVGEDEGFLCKEFRLTFAHWFSQRNDSRLYAYENRLVSIQEIEIEGSPCHEVPLKARNTYAANGNPDYVQVSNPSYAIDISSTTAASFMGNLSWLQISYWGSPFRLWTIDLDLYAETIDYYTNEFYYVGYYDIYLSNVAGELGTFLQRITTNGRQQFHIDVFNQNLNYKYINIKFEYPYDITGTDTLMANGVYIYTSHVRFQRFASDIS